MKKYLIIVWYNSAHGTLIFDVLEKVFGKTKEEAKRRYKRKKLSIDKTRTIDSIELIEESQWMKWILKNC